MKNEAGSSLLETLVALALLGTISMSFLSALGTSSNARFIADEHATARILAESQMEHARKQTYALSYDAAPIPAEFAGFTAIIDVESLRNGNIQLITVTIRHHNTDITALESYKVNR